MTNILDMLEQTAGRLPDKIAVIDEQGEITYQALAESARQVGSFLIGRKVALGQPIPVLMEKGIPALTCFLGSVYAGCFYVLLNPELPQTRLQNMVQLLDAGILITDAEHQKLAEAITDREQVVFAPEALATSINETVLETVRVRHIDVDPLYANFTSGSTGTPKGVLISHRSVIDFIPIFTSLFGIGEGDMLANQAPFDFDVSVKDIYSCLYTGATLLIVPRRLFSRPVELLDFLTAYPVTTMVWAVSALCLVTTFHGLDYKVPGTVKHILFSGEVMPMKHLQQWMAALPEAEFVNLYGPTEITCNCTYHRIERGRDYTGKIPIGRAFPNERVFLLNGDQEITEPDEVGEICVSGTCLGLGYYKDPEQSAKQFMPDPRVQGYTQPMYRTGDLASYNADGELVFQGRRDFQIKYQGHRIELEEIEAAMMQEEGVIRACCLFDEQKGRLYGFYIGDMEEASLREALAARLPAWQIPPRLKRLAEFPLTKNGKINRKALFEQTGRRRHAAL